MQLPSTSALCFIHGVIYSGSEVTTPTGDHCIWALHHWALTRVLILVMRHSCAAALLYVSVFSVSSQRVSVVFTFHTTLMYEHHNIWPTSLTFPPWIYVTLVFVPIETRANSASYWLKLLLQQFPPFQIHLISSPAQLCHTWHRIWWMMDGLTAKLHHAVETSAFAVILHSSVHVFQIILELHLIDQLTCCLLKQGNLISMLMLGIKQQSLTTHYLTQAAPINVVPHAWAPKMLAPTVPHQCTQECYGLMKWKYIISKYKWILQKLIIILH